MFACSKVVKGNSVATKAPCQRPNCVPALYCDGIYKIQKRPLLEFTGDHPIGTARNTHIADLGRHLLEHVGVCHCQCAEHAYIGLAFVQ